MLLLDIGEEEPMMQTLFPQTPFFVCIGKCTVASVNHPYLNFKQTTKNKSVRNEIFQALRSS